MLYENDVNVKNAAHSTILDFIKRNIDRGDINPTKFKQAYHYCLEYLLEESSIIMPLFALEKFEFVIYPSKMLDILYEIRKLTVEITAPDTVQWLSLRFKRMAMRNDEE